MAFAPCSFKTVAAAATGEADYSELNLVWFQEAWALPLDPRVEELIRRVDWATHAHDMIW